MPASLITLPQLAFDMVRTVLALACYGASSVNAHIIPRFTLLKMIIYGPVPALRCASCRRLGCTVSWWCGRSLPDHARHRAWPQQIAIRILLPGPLARIESILNLPLARLPFAFVFATSSTERHGDRNPCGKVSSFERGADHRFAMHTKDRPPRSAHENPHGWILVRQNCFHFNPTSRHHARRVPGVLSSPDSQLEPRSRIVLLLNIGPSCPTSQPSSWR